MVSEPNRYTAAEYGKLRAECERLRDAMSQAMTTRDAWELEQRMRARRAEDECERLRAALADLGSYIGEDIGEVHWTEAQAQFAKDIIVSALLSKGDPSGPGHDYMDPRCINTDHASGSWPGEPEGCARSTKRSRGLPDVEGRNTP